MAPWRNHLPDQTIRWLDLLTGKRSLLAAWTQAGKVFYFDLIHGTPAGERVFEPPPADDRQSDAWRQFTRDLTAPNQTVLPMVRTRGTIVHSSLDGTMRLLRLNTGDLYLDLEGKEVRLLADDSVIFVAVGFDRELGLVAALDSTGKLHIYQQHMRIGVFDTGLDAREDWRPAVRVPNKGALIFVTDGRRVVTLDSGGKIRKQLTLHYDLQSMACSPDGKHLAISDSEFNVIRVYRGSDLQLTHQRFASDLLVEAKRVQLMASAPTHSAISALAISNRGVVAFAMAGTICASNIERMGTMPRV